MKSIAARLTFAYATCFVVSMALLSFAGARLIENRLVQASDAMVDSQYGRIRNHLIESEQSANPVMPEAKLRRLTDSTANLVYVQVMDNRAPAVFLSANLQGRRLPLGNAARYPAALPGFGELMVSRYAIVPHYVVLVATSRHPVLSAMRSYIEIFAALCLAALLVGALTGYAMSQLSLAPLRQIRETCERINLETLDARIPVSAVDDEISGLARLLNAMLDRLVASVAQMRRFTADASHELKTPLSLMRLHVERLAGDAGLTAEQRATLDELGTDMTHLQQIISGLLLLSRVDSHTLPITMTTQSAQEFLEAFRSDAAALCEDRGCRFALIHFGDGKVVFDARWLRQVLLNLLTNALHASPQGGVIVIESTVDAAEWRLTTHDQGIGLAAEHHERIFERFVRGHAGTEGSGLGLAICKSVILLHGGTIRAAHGLDGIGFQVSFSIPREASPTLAPGLSIEDLTNARYRRDPATAAIARA